ncbi:MAG: LuxR C-terminal-related transcriptional regulator [Bacteroidota bacterium]
MIKNVTFIFLAMTLLPLRAQYRFGGHTKTESSNATAYLSLVEDYRRSSRVYPTQIIRKTRIDTSGQFWFEGNNLLVQNRIYRIHIDTCMDNSMDTAHVLGQCAHTSSILFIANNNDTLFLPKTASNEIFCEINSTNSSASVFLAIDSLKEEMVFDFAEYPSETNRKLNSKKWLSTFQEMGTALNEPLAELYLYDFLSDKRSELFPYYLDDLIDSSYYDALLQRLRSSYPNAMFTQQYEAELKADRLLAPRGPFDGKWVLWLALTLSLVLNGYFMARYFQSSKQKKQNALQKLSAQEQKVIHKILEDKSNKEIAGELFISHSTVKTHINNLYKKLNVSSRKEIKSAFQQKK